MKNHFLFLLTLSNSLSNDVLVHVQPNKLELHEVYASVSTQQDIQCESDLIIKSSMTPDTYLSFKLLKNGRYQVTRLAFSGQSYWPTKIITVIGEINRIVAAHNSVFFTTTLGHMYEFDEETNHLVNYSTNCISWFLKESNKGVYIIETSEQSPNGFTRFKVIEINKNDISEYSQDISVPVTTQEDLIAKHMGDGLILSARNWSTIFRFSNGLTLTTIPIDFHPKDKKQLIINNITTDYLNQIYVHLVSNEPNPCGYFLTLSNGIIRQRLETHNILSIRRQRNGRIAILATDTPWNKKGYFNFLADVVRNSEAARILDETGETQAQFRLQTDTFAEPPRLLKNCMIAATYKTPIGLQLSLLNLDGQEITPPCLKFVGINVFSDGSCLILGKNNKRKYDWVFYNSLYYLPSPSSSPIHVTDSPTAISLRNWQKL